MLVLVRVMLVLVRVMLVLVRVMLGLWCWIGVSIKLSRVVGFILGWFELCVCVCVDGCV